MQVDKDIYDGYFYDDVSENNQLLFITPTGSVVNSKFYIYMSLNTINMSVSRLDCITVGINYYCSCFVTKNNKIKPNKPSNEIFMVHKRPNKESITIDDIIQTMINVKYTSKCNHCVLDGFIQKTLNEFEASFTRI